MTAGRRYDVIVVGARCAGSALATFLARTGARVLVVDRDAHGTDQVQSTHTIHPPGVDVLDELGVGDAIRAVTPRGGTVRLRKGRSHVDIAFPAGRDELCPRRMRLDALLQDAAARAGAELRDRTRVTRVLLDGERATGVELQHDGRGEAVESDLVIGADGRRSLVAQQVGAEEYMAYDAPRAMYWAYWDEPTAWRSADRPFDMYLGQIGLDFRFIFQTDDEQLLIGALPPVEAALGWRRDPLTALRANLARDDVVGPLLAGAAPASGVRGTVKERYYFRRAVGDGWALVGDAGHHKDFIVGDGITEALLQARSLAGAIGEGTAAALRRWWRARDVEAWPTFHWGRDEGEVAPPTELECLVIDTLARDERLARMMTQLPDHKCSPYDVPPLGAVLPVIARAVLRGQFRVVPELMAQMRRAMTYQRTLRERMRLLDELPAREGMGASAPAAH